MLSQPQIAAFYAETSAETASVPDFYHDDELKYHGKENRGVTSINFYDEIKLSLNDQSGLDFCGGEWKYPRTCRSGKYKNIK